MSNSLRNPASTSAKSIDFASDRSPLQKLERELKNISQTSEADAEGVVRSLSRRHVDRQRGSVSSTASPTFRDSQRRIDRDDSISGSRRQPRSPQQEQQSQSPPQQQPRRIHPHPLPPTPRPDEEDEKQAEMNTLGRRKSREVEIGEEGEINRGDYYKTQSGAEDLTGPQATYDAPPQNPSAIESNSKPRFRHQHRKPFGRGSRGSGSGSVTMPTESIGGGFTHDVARLTLADREAGGQMNHEPYQDGRNEFQYQYQTGPLPTDVPSHMAGPNSLKLNIPASLDGPADTEDPAIPRPSHGESERGGDDAAGGHHHLHLHYHVHEPEHPSHHHHPDHLRAPHKEEREDALTLAYIRAIPHRPVPDSQLFRPNLSVKCGPLLRYTGLRRDNTSATPAQGGRETWRGSVMILTTDSGSEYSPTPSLCLFYVDDAEGSKQDGRKGRFVEIQSLMLHAEHGVAFWRFNLEVELADTESKIAYQINHGPIVHFWVPARGQTMNIMFHSCNGFSLSVNPDDFCGPDPLWRDVLEKHKQRPFHVMLGGGDQSRLP